MASVSVVSSTDFRANHSQPQNNAPEGDDPFSLLLNSVGDAKASVQRPEAPKAVERRADVPAKQPKPEADADRQAKRQAKDAAKPEAAPQTESSSLVKTAVADDEVEDTDTDSDDTVIADPLLTIALGETQQAVTAEVVVDINAPGEVAAASIAPANVEAAAEIQTAPGLAAVAAGAATAAVTETQPIQAVQATAAAKPQFEIPAASMQAEAETEITLPKISTETVSSLTKPLKTAFSLEAQAHGQTQPGSVNTVNATPLRAFAPLEALNAAIDKQAQLSLALAPVDAKTDGLKPLISSNAVAPNFAMTAQVTAPVQVQTQAVAEATRAVPLDQLAVEIATRASKGERRFDIRLDPPELGRIDVRLEIDSKGNTTTKLIVERAETLDMLQRDARGLEKALQNAGLKTDAGSMQFSLQQDTQAQHGHQDHVPEMRGRSELVQAETDMTEVSINNATLAAQMRGGVDIRI